MIKHPKVFISYSHQGIEYEKKILEFTNRLRLDGIDANVDLYEEAPSEGWPRWMENQINDSDFIIIVNSKSYYEKIYLDSGKSKGVSWEVNIIYQFIYDAFMVNKKFIPVYFDKGEEQYILKPLKPYTFYNVGDKEGFDKLYWRLRGIPKTQKPPIGDLRALPEKEQKTMFISTPINLDEWNNAEWRGMIYLFSPDNIPVLGLLFYNYIAGKTIFNEWKIEARDDFADAFINVTYITPPFPNDCWVYKDKEKSFGKGYFVHIGPNIEESVKRALESGIESEELLVTSVSRYQWMDELNGSKSRETFQHLIKNGLGYLLIPIGVKDKKKPIVESNLIMGFPHAIRMKNATFKTGIEVEDNDLCKVVLEKPQEV